MRGTGLAKSGTARSGSATRCTTTGCGAGRSAEEAPPGPRPATGFGSIQVAWMMGSGWQHVRRAALQHRRGEGTMRNARSGFAAWVAVWVLVLALPCQAARAGEVKKPASLAWV